MCFTDKNSLPHQSSAMHRLMTSPLRGGMTLVELLVVIVLVTTLVSTAIPIISPGGEDRKLREASRNVNSYLQGAQARAIQTGRPFGVAFQRLSETTNRGEDNATVTQLRYVEVPAPYSGFDTSSRARICVATNANGIRQLVLQMVRYGSTDLRSNDELPDDYDKDLVPDQFFRPGDEVVLGGSRYVLEAPTSLGTNPFTGGQLRPATLATTGAGAGYFNTTPTRQMIFVIRPAEEDSSILSNPTPGSDLRVTHDNFGQPLRGPESLAAVTTFTYFCTTPAPYKIYRQPVPAGGEPLELPSGIAIDLQASIFGNGTRLYQPTQSPAYVSGEFVPINDPVMVMFSPEGNLDKAYLTQANQLASASVTSTLALCIGRRELMPPERAASSLGKTGGIGPFSVPEGYDEPIDLEVDLAGLTEDEAREITDKYNWLNLESRWVIVGAQSGSVSTVDTSAVYPSVETKTFGEQLQAALDNVQRRSKAGGR